MTLPGRSRHNHAPSCSRGPFVSPSHAVDACTVFVPVSICTRPDADLRDPSKRESIDRGRGRPATDRIDLNRSRSTFADWWTGRRSAAPAPPTHRADATKGRRPAAGFQACFPALRPSPSAAHHLLSLCAGPCPSPSPAPPSGAHWDRSSTRHRERARTRDGRLSSTSDPETTAPLSGSASAGQTNHETLLPLDKTGRREGPVCAQSSLRFPFSVPSLDSSTTTSRGEGS